jgi:hypothetical protein
MLDKTGSGEQRANVTPYSGCHVLAVHAGWRTKLTDGSLGTFFIIPPPLDHEEISSIMNRDHIEAWRDYLVGQMHERYGMANQVAQRTVARWLGSLGRMSALEVQQGLEATPIRNQRFPSSRGLRTRPSARQTRAAGA